MPDPGLRLNGENVAVTIFANGAPFAQSQILKSGSIKPKITAHDDAFIGSDADDPDQQLRGWEFDFDAFVVDTALADMLLAREAKKSARVAFETLSIGLIVLQRDGTNKGYFLQKCEIQPPDITFQGANERVMHGLKGRAKYFKPASI